MLTSVQIWRIFCMEMVAEAVWGQDLVYLMPSCLFHFMCSDLSLQSKIRSFFPALPCFLIYWLPYIKEELKCMSSCCFSWKMDFNGCLVLVDWLESWSICANFEQSI
jgi:hypothetical protein